MKVSKCVWCKQILPEEWTAKDYVNLKPCNSPDGDGHLWENNVEIEDE